MKKVLLILFTLLSFVLNAESQTGELVSFQLNENGLYKAPDGKDYQIILFPNKSSKQIYDELLQNITSVYVNAEKVLNTVENKQIKIRAYSDNVVTNKQLGMIIPWSGFYIIEIEIRDGRIKLHAPYIDDEISALGGTASYQSIFKSNYKNGKLKKKCDEGLLSVQNDMNLIVNLILGNHKNREDDNW